MITIYTSKSELPPGVPICMDVEDEFSFMPLTGDSFERHVISLIDKGKYADETSFYSRFNTLQDRSKLSTGCKAALVVHQNPNKIINCVEAGSNALSEILKLCDGARILLPNQCYYFDTLGDYDKIPILYKGHIFESIKKLAAYMYDDWPDDPNDIEKEEDDILEV